MLPTVMPRTKEFDQDDALEKAMTLFWEQGYEATTVEDLLRCTGLSRSSLYDTFGGKRALYLKAIDRYRRGMGQELRRLLKNQSSTLEAIENLFLGVAREPEAARRGCLMVNATVEQAPLNEETARRIEENLAFNREAFREAIERAQADKEIDPDRDADALALMLVNTYHGLRVTAKAGASTGELEAVARATLAGLRRS